MRIEYWATICFAISIIHTFFGSFLSSLGSGAKPGSIKENFFHLIGEVEIVFGLWSAIFLIGYALMASTSLAVTYAESLNFVEPLFVFAIMATAATAPTLQFAEKAMTGLARFLPIEKNQALLVSFLVLGPLLGSLITEPAAMTVTAILLKKTFFDRKPSSTFLYASLAVLFVNISIGGTLTHFAAPPVLMVAKTWNWDFAFMFEHFGWKAIIGVVINAVGLGWILRKELRTFTPSRNSSENAIPYWIVAVHLIFLALVVLFSHHPVIFIGAFLFFLGFVHVTGEYQAPVKLRESLLVAFFLGGLVVLGTLQRWWLGPLVQSMGDTSIFFAATGLTALTDNAALTYLGSQISGLSESFQYYLVAGAVAGGGLTVIANAPNPAGYSILQSSFGEDGISALKLFLFALAPTIIAMLALGLL